MSARRPSHFENTEATRLRSELEALKKQAVNVTTTSALCNESVSSFEQLSGTEQAAGSLGVHPDAWKPVRAASFWPHNFCRMRKLTVPSVRDRSNS
jgi:hypothetical protein